jgi:hypothetical protein
VPEVVWFFDRLFLARPLDFGEVAVVPLRVRVDTLCAALAAYRIRQGAPLDAAGSSMDVAAVVFRDANGEDADKALTATSVRARAVASALGFRQMGRGRLLGAVVHADGADVIRRAPDRYPQVTNLPFVPEEQEVGALIQSFADHPQAIVLADLFAEGCRDENPSAGVVRLWAVLEALAEKFPGTKLGKVRGALRQLQINELELGGGLLLDRAYKVRNDFMHLGVLAPIDTAAKLRAELADLTSFTLRHAGLAPVAPAAKPHRALG